MLIDTASPRSIRRTPLDRWVAERLGCATASPDRQAITRWQIERLQETVAWAQRRSPYYAERLAGVGEIASLSDLARVPFTTADDLRKQGPELLCVSQGEIARVVTFQSSGTTGAPKRIFFSAAEQETTIDFFAHGMSTLVGGGDRVLILLPGATPGSVGALLAAALERIGARPIPHGFVRDLPEAAAVLRRERPTSLVGVPVHALALARFAEASGVRRAPRTALLTTDHVPRSIVAELRRIWGCQVFEHYGMTEMALGGAVDCEAHEGCHVREPDLLLEIIDPATGEPAPPGSLGEIVFTTLTRRAMPLIRYRTGDISRVRPGRCACGSSLLRLERLRARRTALRLPGGVTLCDLDEALFAIPNVIDFSAAARPGRASTRLSVVIRALGVRRDVGAERALDAIEAIPVLRRAHRNGELEVDVVEEHATTLLSTGAAKRVLSSAA
jgi:phenylacetate-coenzyme A ligase PaaK-like adenylate-forming protein